MKNYFCCNGIIPGFSQSGGLGLLLAQWIVEGEPEFDLFPWDMARFGGWASKSFVRARALDAYSHRYKIHFPYEERDAGRPVRAPSCPPNARRPWVRVFGLNYGWEHPLWYAGNGGAAEETYWLRTARTGSNRSGGECRALRAGVGVVDISN